MNKNLTKIVIIGFILILCLSFVSAQEIIERGADFEIVDNYDGTLSKTYFPKQVNILENGTYIPITDLLNVKFNKQTGDLVYSYKDYSATMRMFFVVDVSQSVCDNRGWFWEGNDCVMFAPEVREFINDNNIKFNIITDERKSIYKYALNISDLPEVYSDRLKFVGLHLESVEGLTWDDVNRVGTSLYLKNRVKLDFQDLIDTGHTLQFYDKRTLLIGNVAGNQELFLDPTVEYNFTDTTYAKAYWFSQAGTEVDANATGTEFASYGNVDENDGALYSTSESGTSNRLAQHNFHYTIQEDLATISQIDLLYSGQNDVADCSISTNSDIDVKTDSGHEKIGDITSSDADYTKSITSSISNYLDGDNKLYMRAYSRCNMMTSGTIFIRTDYPEVVVTYADSILVTEQQVNASDIDSGEEVEFKVNVTSPTGGTIDTIILQTTYPNGTAVNNTVNKDRTTGITTTSDLESGTQTHSGDYSTSSCSNNGACSGLSESPCNACPSCSYSASCPVIYGWNGNEYIAEHESFPFAIFNVLEESTYDTIHSAKCIDGEMKIKIQENLPEETFLKDFQVYLSNNPNVKPDIDGNMRTINSQREPTWCNSDVFTDAECKELIRYRDEIQYEPTFDKDVEMRYLELVFNDVETDNAKLYVSGHKVNPANNYYYYLVHTLGANKYEKISELSKLKILEPIFRKTFSWVRTDVQVWDGTEWIKIGDFALGQQLMNNGNDDVVVSVPKLDESTDQLKVRIVFFDGLFGYDQIYLDDTPDEGYDLRRAEPKKILFNDYPISNLDRNMVQGDKIEIWYDCQAGDTATTNITGFYHALSPSKTGDKDLLSALYDWGGWLLVGSDFVSERIDYMGFDKGSYYQYHCSDTTAPEMYQERQKETPLLIKFIYAGIILTIILILVMIFTKLPKWIGITIIILIWLAIIIPPVLSSGCSGTLNCATHNSDQSSCEGCSVCTWNPTVEDTEVNETAVEYLNIDTTDITSITRVNVSVVITTYDNSGSTQNANNDADLFLQMYNGSNWLDIGDFGVSTTATYSLSTTEASILSAWETAGNRDIRVYGIDLDGTSTNTDDIAWNYVDVDIYGDSWNQDYWSYIFTDTTQSGQHNLTHLFSNTTSGSTNTTMFVDLNFTVSGAEPSDSCDCAGSGNNWEIDLSDYCVISDNCDLGTGNITWTGTGNITFDARIQATSIADLPANQKGWLTSSADVEIKE